MEKENIYKIGFDCETYEGEKCKKYLIVSIPNAIIDQVCEDDNIGYYFDKFNDKLSEIYGVGISDYLVEDITSLDSSYKDKIDLILHEDERDEDELSDEEHTTICINPFLKRVKVPRKELEDY